MYFKIFPKRIIPEKTPKPIGKRILKLYFIFLKKFNAQLSTVS